MGTKWPPFFLQAICLQRPITFLNVQDNVFLARPICVKLCLLRRIRWLVRSFGVSMVLDLRFKVKYLAGAARAFKAGAYPWFLLCKQRN